MLLCAGPFSRTSRPVVDACLALGIHYLDITGEIPVFEACHARTDEAARAGSILLPGVGFDVVPSDCLAAALAARLPDATSLVLGFHSIGTPSAGTAKVGLGWLAEGGAVRRDGRIHRVPLAAKIREVPFHDKPRRAALVPWGDVSTAYYSTGIGNIEVYMAQPQRVIRAMQLVRPARRLFRLDPVQRVAERLIERRLSGPDAAQRESGKSEVWGRVQNDAGAVVEGTLTTPEAYHLTSLTSVAAVEAVLAGGIEPRTHTPATAFGAEFITRIEGCTLRVPTAPAAPGPQPARPAAKAEVPPPPPL